MAWLPGAPSKSLQPVGFVTEGTSKISKLHGIEAPSMWCEMLERANAHAFDRLRGVKLVVCVVFSGCLCCVVKRLFGLLQLRSGQTFT